MDEVAERAGVSQSTVSRALRGSAKVRPETRERVQAIARELGFVPSRSASSLASGKLRRIAVLIGSPLVDWFSGSVLDGLYPVLSEAGYDLVLYRVHDRMERSEFFATLPAERNADALIVASFTLDEAEHARLAEMGMPVVYLNQSSSQALSVSIDDESGARSAVRHLLRLGHERIAFLRHDPLPGFQWSALRRYDGYRSALAEAGIEPDPALHLVIPQGTGIGSRALSALLELEPTPSAVFVENDDVAVKLLIALGESGLRCPDDISVVGFDDQDLASAFGLTTVAQPATALASTAARLAVALANGDRSATESVVLPTQLILRSSARRVPGVAR